MSGAITALTMPKWGIEMTEGTINAWSATVGQTVAKGDALLEVETDKIVNTVEAPVAGTLRRLNAAVGDVRAVGSLLGVFAAPEVSDGEIDAFIAAFRGEVVSFEPDAGGGAITAPGGSTSLASSGVGGKLSNAAGGAVAPASSVGTAEGAGEARVSPIARRLAERLGVDLTEVRGTGRGGRISQEDVEAYVAARAASVGSGGADSSGGAEAQRNVRAPAATGAHIGASTGENPSTRKRMSATRVTIASRLLQSSQTIPHYRLAVTAVVERLMNLKRDFAARSINVSINDFVLRAAGLALVTHRALNARLEDSDIVEFEHADIAIAVATDSGLITPVLRRVNEKSVETIAQESADLSARARAGALTRQDLEGGTFTISNLGMFGIERFDAIINPPQVAILAVGSAQPSVVVRDAGTTVARTMVLTLSADHRVIDGAVAAQFLSTLRTLIETGEL